MDRWEGGEAGEGGGGGLEAEGVLNSPVRAVWISDESQKCQPYAQPCLDGLKDISLSGVNFRPIPSM